LPDALSRPPRARWLVTGRLHDIAIEVSGDHPDLRRRIEELLEQLAPSASGEPAEALRFSLGSLDGDADHPALVGPRALVQFVNVTCVRDGSWSVFTTKDGSFLRADVRAGWGWGRVSAALLRGAPYPLNDLVMAPLMEMLKERGFCGLHAAAITRQGRGYLFPGDSGSGKTTIALGLLRRGCGYLADDKVLLRREDAGAIAALAFTHRFNIDADLTRFYPEVSGLESPSPLPPTAKRPFDVSKLYPNAFRPRCRPSALIHLQRAPGGVSRISPLSPTASLVRLTRQTILASRRDRAAMQLRLLGDLVTSVDNYLVENGRDPAGSPERLLELVSRL
jgi:hypothetical protein